MQFHPGQLIPDPPFIPDWREFSIQDIYKILHLWFHQAKDYN